MPAAVVVSVLLAGAAVAAVTAVAVILACRRPHLPNAPRRGTLVAAFRRQRAGMLTDLVTRYGLTTEFEGYLVTADPALAGHLLTTAEHTAKRSRFYAASSWLLPHLDGVLNRDGPGWVRHVKALAPLFRSRAIEAQRPAMYAAAVAHARCWCSGIAASDGLLDAASLARGGAVWDAGAPSGGATGGHDLVAAVRGISLEVLMRWAYGLGPAAPLAQELAELMTAYGRLVAALAQKPLVAACNYAALRGVGSAIVDTTRRIIAARESNNEGGGEDGISLMRAAGLPLAEIAAEVNHVHGAHKAAAFVIAHALADLGAMARVVPPRGRGDGSLGRVNVSDVAGAWWADRMRAEADRVLGADGIPSRDDVLAGRLPIAGAVLAESTRRHVVSLGVVRRTGLPLHIDDTVIPGGTEVVILLQALHHLPAFWLRATEFRPERWLTAEVLAGALAAERDHAGGAACPDLDAVDLGSAVVGSALACKSAGSRDAAGTSSNAVAADGSGSGGGGPHFSSCRDVAGRAVGLPREEDAEAAAVADGTVKPPPYAFIPFLTGGRMCSGKILAETEFLVIVTAVLRTVRISTHLTYVAHIGGEAMGTAPGRPVARFLREHSFDAAGKKVQVSPCDACVVRHPAYTGPLSMLLADNMYSSNDADWPFSAVRALPLLPPVAAAATPAPAAAAAAVDT